MKKMYLLFIIAFLGVRLFAQTGVLDVEFGNKGMVTNAYDTVNMNGHTSVLQADGKIIMAGGNGSNKVTLVRYNASGLPDNSFGTNGKAVISAPAGSMLGGNSASLAVQADGKIIYAGSASGKIALARLNTNGTLDNTFGTSGISYAQYDPMWLAYVWKVIVKPDGKILTGGTARYNGTTNYFEIAQFSSTGAVDASFGTNGFFHYSAGQSGGCYSIALMPNGNIMAGGLIFSLPGTMSVVSVLSTGQLNSAYGTGGIASGMAYPANMSLFCRIVPQRDGKMLVVGYGTWNGGTAIGLSRFKTDGKADTTFAYLGTLTTTFKNFQDVPQNVTEQSDGKLVISGCSSGNFAMMRLKPNGTTDTMYGRLGKVLTPMPGISGQIASSFTQPDGKLVLTGFSKINNNYNFVAGRFVVNVVPYYNSLKGHVFIDANYNGVKDAGETNINNAKLKIVKQSADSFTTYTSNGEYLFDLLDTGTYVCNAQVSYLYYSVPVPVNYTTSHADYYNVDSIDFALQAKPGIRDAAINLSFESGVARVGTVQHYHVDYKNKGTDVILSGEATFVIDPKVTFVSAVPAPSAIHGDTLIWNIANLAPLETVSVAVDLSIPVPPVVALHDYLGFSGTITTERVDITPADNYDTLPQIIGNAYDPNGKSETHTGRITPTAIAAGDYLKYTIFFQNTGNDTAINIFIRDTLSNQLDWNTLEMLDASANYQMMMNDGKCLWTFGNIWLPDSNHSEPNSHGYFTYRIKPKPTLQIGDVINNTAAIYFDYNLPVFTNTEKTTVVSNVQPVRLLAFTAKKDGKTNLLQWSTASEINFDRFEVQRSADGREFSNIGMVGSQSSVVSNHSYSFTDHSPLTHNYYRLKMMDKDGSFTYSPVVQVAFPILNFPFSISIYPNPAKDILQVQVSSDKKTALQLKVISQDGKTLVSQQWNVNEGTAIYPLNVTRLQSGNYYLKVTADNKEQSVVKFEKL